jgi:hypothetical protein
MRKRHLEKTHKSSFAQNRPKKSLCQKLALMIGFARCPQMTFFEQKGV